MPVLTCASTLGRAWVLAIALTHHAVAQSTADSAVAVLKSPIGNVGTVSFTQVPAGVLLKVSLRGMPRRACLPHSYGWQVRRAIFPVGGSALQS